MICLSTLLQSMGQIASEVSELQKKALLGTLTEGDMQGGTFTLVRDKLLYLGMSDVAVLFNFLFL